MKRTSTLCLLVSLVLTLVLALSLASCGETPCTHTYGAWEITKAPTCEAEGTQTQVCSLCGDTKTDTVPPTGHTADSLRCHTCDAQLVAMESLVPEQLPTDEYTVTAENLFFEGRLIEKATVHVYPDADGKPFAYGTVSFVDEDGTLSLFYEDGTAYVYTTGVNTTASMAVFAKDLIAALMDDPSALLDPETVGALTEYAATVEALLAWFEEYVAPSLGDAELPPVTEPVPPAMDEADARALLEALFTVVKNDTNAGATLTLDYAYLKACNATLAEMTVADYIDYTLGEGTLDSLKTTVPMLLAFSVEDALTLLSEQGITLTDYATEIDALLAAALGEGASVEAVLGAPLSDLLADEEVLATTVSDLLCSALSTESTPVTETDILYEINSYLGMLEVAKLYSLFETNEMTDVKGTVDALIDSLAEMLNVVITVDESGAFESAKLILSDEYSRVTLRVLNDRTELIATSGFDTSSICVTYTPDKTPNLNTLAAAKDGIVYLPIDADALAENGFEAIYADDGETVIGATYSELSCDFAYVDEEYGYASYGVYTVDLTATPFMIGCITEDGEHYVEYIFLGTYTLYEFEFTPGDSFTFDGAEPTTVTSAPEMVYITVTDASDDVAA